MLWQPIYERVARHFGAEVGPPLRTVLRDEMKLPEYAEGWEPLVERHGLLSGEEVDRASASQF